LEKFIDAPTKYKNKQGKWITKNNESSITYTKIYCDLKTYSSFEYIRYNLKGEVFST